jgi:hypothetical protein
MSIPATDHSLRNAILAHIKADAACGEAKAQRDAAADLVTKYSRERTDLWGQIDAIGKEGVFLDGERAVVLLTAVEQEGISILILPVLGHLGDGESAADKPDRARDQDGGH